MNTENLEYYKDNFDKIEKNRGRLEHRQLKVFEASPEIKLEYPHCNSVICINRARLLKDKESKETHYYLSDLSISAEEFFKGIRGHWSIENNLHWVKDVLMDEDKANMRNKQISSTLSLLRSFVITLSSIFSGSLTQFQRDYAHNMDLAHLF